MGLDAYPEYPCEDPLMAVPYDLLDPPPDENEEPPDLPPDLAACAASGVANGFIIIIALPIIAGRSFACFISASRPLLLLS